MEEKQYSENKYKRLFKDTGLFAISGFASKILLFLLTPLYTALLATEEYGIADLIITTINLAFPVLTLAITDATLRFAMNKSIEKKSVLFNSFIIVTCSSLVLLCLYPLAGYIDISLSTYWLYFVFIYILYSLHECFSTYLKSTGRTTLFAIQGVIQTVFLIIGNLFFLLWLRMGLSGYLISIIISHIPAIIFMIIVGKIYKDFFPIKKDSKLLKEMLVYSIPLIPATIAWFVNTSIDKYMIINMYGIGESGIYSVAHKIPTIISTLITFFISAWTLSSIQNHGSSDESEYTTKIYNILNFLMISGCIFVIAFDKLISRLLFANDYYIAWTYVPFLTISAVFSALSGFLAGPYRAEKKTMSLLLSVIIGAVVNILLNIVLLNAVGVIGAAIATAVSFFVVWVVRIIVVQKIVKIKPQIIVTIISFACMIVSAILTTYNIEQAFYICFALLAIVIISNYKNLKELFKLFKIFFNKKRM